MQQSGRTCAASPGRCRQGIGLYSLLAADGAVAATRRYRGAVLIHAPYGTCAVLLHSHISSCMRAVWVCIGCLDYAAWRSCKLFHPYYSLCSCSVHVLLVCCLSWCKYPADGVRQHVLLAAAVTQQRCTAVHLPMCTEYCRCWVVDNVLHAWHVVLLMACCEDSAVLQLCTICMLGPCIVGARL
jgi:hypothetical protein